MSRSTLLHQICDARTESVQRTTNVVLTVPAADNSLTLSTDADLETVEARKTRNACTPFGRLPGDVLISIAEYAVIDSALALGMAPHILNMLTGVHSRLRAVLVDTPTLWARVSFGWPTRTIKVFLARGAPSHALALRFNVGTVTEQSCARLAQYLPRTRALTLLWDAGGEHRLVRAMGEVDAPVLEFLTVSALIRPSIPLRQDVLSSHAWSSLRNLQLQRVQMDTIPLMPTLRTVVLMDTRWPLIYLHTLFTYCPLLEVIKLHSAVSSTPTSGPAPQPVHFAHLKHLKIHETMMHAASVLAILPVPHATLSLDVRDMQDGLYHAWGAASASDEDKARALEQILSQLFQFRLRAADETPTTLTVQSEVTLSGPSWDCVHSRGISEHHALLDSVTTLDLYNCWTHRHPGTAYHVDLACFQNVNQLNLAAAEHYPNVQEDIERWLSMRHEQRRPLGSITFRGCSEEMRPFYDGLRTSDVIQCVVWEE